MAVKLFASVDVGSFELELSIYEINSKGDIRCVDHIRHVIALGDDTYQSGLISYQLVDEMCEVLQHFAAVMREYRVEAYRACATSAMREAKNRLIVLDQIKVRTGLEVQILSNAEQRYITYGAIPVREPEFYHMIKKPSAIVDVGFGSTQISMYDSGRLAVTQNMKLGALRMRAMFSHLSSVSNYHALAEELVDNEMGTFWTYYHENRSLEQIIAVGDCIRLFVVKLMNMPEANVVSTADFIRTYKQVQGISANDMVLNYDVPEEFAELLLPAAMIYYRFLIASNAQYLWIPGVNLCDGLVTEYAVKQKLYKQPHDFVEDTLEAARKIRKRYYGNEMHSDMLEVIVAQLFDSMKKYHGLGKRSRLLLQLAAILHDCGKFISMNAPGECAYCIIKETEILGLSDKEQLMLANIVRYNTIELLYDEQPEDALDAESYRTVIKLTAMLRLANVLDRSHRQKMKNVKVTVKGRELLIAVDVNEDISLERGLLQGKASFFEQVFGLIPVLRQKQKNI